MILLDLLILVLLQKGEFPFLQVIYWGGIFLPWPTFLHFLMYLKKILLQLDKFFPSLQILFWQAFGQMYQCLQWSLDFSVHQNGCIFPRLFLLSLH